MSTINADNMAENIAKLASNNVISVVSSASSTTVTITFTTLNNTSVQILPANTVRKGCIIWNNRANSIYISYAATSSSSICTYIIPSFTSWTMPNPCYQGVISGISNAGTGTVTGWELY